MSHEMGPNTMLFGTLSFVLKGTMFLVVKMASLLPQKKALILACKGTIYGLVIMVVEVWLCQCQQYYGYYLQNILYLINFGCYK